MSNPTPDRFEQLPPGFAPENLADTVPLQRLVIEVGAGRYRPLAWKSLADQRNFSDSEQYLGIDLGTRATGAPAKSPIVTTEDQLMREHWNALVQERPGKALNFVQADGTKLPLADAVADEVIFNNVFGWGTLSEEHKLLQEAMRVLKEDGDVIIHDYLSPRYRSWPHTATLISKAGFMVDTERVRLMDQTTDPFVYQETAEKFGLYAVAGLDAILWQLGKLSVPPPDIDHP